LSACLLGTPFFAGGGSSTRLTPPGFILYSIFWEVPYVFPSVFSGLRLCSFSLFFHVPVRVLLLMALSSFSLPHGLPHRTQFPETFFFPLRWRSATLSFTRFFLLVLSVSVAIFTVGVIPFFKALLVDTLLDRTLASRAVLTICPFKSKHF